jgi:uncharacterized protein YraI
MKTFVLSALTGAFVALSGAALADTSVSAVTDLNVRAGPGSRYPVVGVLAAGQSATLTGCIANSKWCTIAAANGPAWVYSDYVTADFGGRQVVLTERPADADVTIVEAPPPPDGMVAVDDATTAAIDQGPATDDDLVAVDPPSTVRTYIASRPSEPVYLQGEVVRGATLPDTVELQPIPDYDYDYVYVNNQPVLVEPQSRRIVYIVR